FAVRFRNLDDRNLTIAVHDNEITVLVFDSAEVEELDESVVARLERGLLGATARGTTDVERTHGELRARLTDRLRGDDADRLTGVDDVSACEVTAVAASADALA